MCSRKGRLFAALGLVLGILDTALYLNQLIREPGRWTVRSTSLPYILVIIKCLVITVHLNLAHLELNGLYTVLME